MLDDPLTLTVVAPTAGTDAAVFSGAGKTELAFVATGRGPTSSTYRYAVSASHYIDMLVSRQVGKRTRYTVRLTEYELVTDPINSELNAQKTSTIYFVADVGVLGTGTNWTQMAMCLANFLYKPVDSVLFLDSLIVKGQT